MKLRVSAMMDGAGLLLARRGNQPESTSQQYQHPGLNILLYTTP
jgi:hypothetical protein